MNEELRRIRKAAQLTQEQLAARSGVDQTTISRLEVSGSDPNGDTKRKLVDALRDAVHQLIPIEDDARAELQSSIDVLFVAATVPVAVEPERVAS